MSLLRPASTRPAALALAAALTLPLAGCRGSIDGPVRLGALLPRPAATGVALPAGFTVGAEPTHLTVAVDAARFARLELTAHGDAGMVRLAWRLAGEAHLVPYRALAFALAADGEEHTYQVQLAREPYWTGRVEELELSVEGGGDLTVTGFAAYPAATPYRDTLLAGESEPSLPGLSRLEVPLPADLAGQALFETALGLVAGYDKAGVEVRFRVTEETAAGERRPWLDETLRAPGAAEWHPFSRRVRLGGGGKLVLEVEASRHGRPLPEGVAFWGDPRLQPTARLPGRNLVVVVVDTLRADVVGSYGDATGITPRLDAFARRAVRFADVHAPAPWTLPSVSSLLTGLQPQTHGAGRQLGAGKPEQGLPESVRTLAEVLSGAGFYTSGIYDNIYLTPAFGLAQGFDRYASHEEPAGKLVDRALAELAALADRRFFLYLHLFDPHNPYQPPPDVCAAVARRLQPGYAGPLGCSADRRPELPVPPPADWPWIEALYRSEVAYTDRELGRFFAGLDRLGLGGDTVVLVVSDHGEEFWQRLEQERAHGYRVDGDHGHALYRDLLHVPALLAVPGLAPAVVADPVETVDLFPTLLRQVGVDPPPNQGHDLSALLAGGRELERRTLMAGFLLHGQDRWAVQRGPWKLVVPESDASLPVELYDLEHDPGELDDVAAAHPDLVAALRRFGESELQARVQARSLYLAGGDSLTATYLEWNHITKLRSLGYLR